MSQVCTGMGERYRSELVGTTGFSVISHVLEKQIQKCWKEKKYLRTGQSVDDINVNEHLWNPNCILSSKCLVSIQSNDVSKNYEFHA